MGCRWAKLVRQCSGNGQRIVAKLTGQPVPVQFEPVVMKRDPIQFFAERTEGVNVTGADPAEIPKIDAEFISRVSSLHEGRLVDTERFDETPNMWQRSLANTDDPDIFALD